jgi:hypothetical protein
MGRRENKSQKCGRLLAGVLMSSSDHLSPRFHHNLTIKKPSSTTMFSQNLLQKQPFTMQEKTIKTTTAGLDALPLL